MATRLERLRAHHRQLDRLIDTTKNLARQEDMKSLKRMRLRLKDRITDLQRRTRPQHAG